MDPRDELRRQIDDLPEPMVMEILDFVQFLRRKGSPEEPYRTPPGEDAPRRSWLTPEEDQAWRDA